MGVVVLAIAVTQNRACDRMRVRSPRQVTSYNALSSVAITIRRSLSRHTCAHTPQTSTTNEMRTQRRLHLGRIQGERFAPGSFPRPRRHRSDWSLPGSSKGPPHQGCERLRAKPGPSGSFGVCLQRCKGASCLLRASRAVSVKENRTSGTCQQSSV